VNVVRDPDFNHLYMIKLVRTKKNTPGIVWYSYMKGYLRWIFLSGSSWLDCS
jgi:hypothetical protein